jgi:hypothetical protein
VTEPRRDGRRFVLLLYGIIVCLAGGLGLVLGAFVPMGGGPDLFFVLSLPPTALGFAVYGAVTVAVALAVPLALVVYLSRREDVDTGSR